MLVGLGIQLMNRLPSRGMDVTGDLYAVLEREDRNLKENDGAQFQSLCPHDRLC